MLDHPFSNLEGEPPAAPVETTRRAQFAQANASLALEGLVVDATDLEIQEAVATGALSPDEAVEKYRQLALEGKA